MAKIILKNVRLSFPSLWETETYNGTDTGKYAASFLVEKDSAQGKALAKAVKDVAEEKFGKPVPKGVKYALKDGDEVEYDGYAGNWAIKANTKKRPVTIDLKKTPVTENDNVLYAGCYVNASIEVYAMDNQYGKRVGCQLNGVQFAKDGESFGAGGSAMDDFEAVETEEDATEEDSPFA